MDRIGPNYGSKMLDDYYRQSLISNLEPDEKSEEMDPFALETKANQSEDLTRLYTPRPVDASIEEDDIIDRELANDPKKHIRFSEDVEVFEFNTQINGSQENFGVVDLCDEVKGKPRKLKSEEKTTQHQDHCKKEKEGIQEFLKNYMSRSLRDASKVQNFLKKLTVFLEGYLDDLEFCQNLQSPHKQICDSSWHQLHTKMNLYSDIPSFQLMMNQLFKKPEGKELLHALLERKITYHTASRDEFKQEFHNYV